MTDRYWQPKYEAEKKAKAAAKRIAEDEEFAKAMAALDLRHTAGKIATRTKT